MDKPISTGKARGAYQCKDNDGTLANSQCGDCPRQRNVRAGNPYYRRGGTSQRRFCNTQGPMAGSMQPTFLARLYDVPSSPLATL